METELVLESGELSAKYHVTTGLFCLTAVPTLAANVLLLFIIFRSTNFRDLSTMLVAFISIADLLYVAYLCGYVALQYMHVYIPHISCAIVITLQSVLRMVPSLTFMLVAFNWYIAKFKPSACFKFHQIHRISVKCFLATWSVSIATNIGVPFVVCNRFHKVAFLAYSMAINFVLNLVLLVVEIFLHCKNLVATRKELADKSQRNTLLSAYNLKITKVFLFLSIAYFVFTAPLLLYRVCEFALGVHSKAFAVYVFHLLSCLPCLMNPISLCFISQRFQDELRSLFCISKRKFTSPGKPTAIEPEAYSVNKGLFEQRTATSRQKNCDRELIYGEYPSSAPPKETSKRKKKDVRFSDVLEEVHEPSSVVDRSSDSSATRMPLPNTTSQTVHDVGSNNVTMTTKDDNNRETRNSPPIALPHDQRSIDTASPGTWPRCHASPYHRYPTIDEIRQQGSLNLLSRTASVYEPRRNSDDGHRNTDPNEAVVSTTNSKTRTLQDHVNVCEEDTVFKTYL